MFSRRKQKVRPVGQETNMKVLGEREAKPTGGFQPQHVGTGSPWKDIRRALYHSKGSFIPCHDLWLARQLHHRECQVVGRSLMT